MDKAMYNLIIAAVFKEEEKWLEEWIVYHLIVGVDHFVMFNNGDKEPSYSILKSYIDAGKVSYYDFPHGRGDIQIVSYDLALHYFRHKTEWLAFLDLDEFAFPIHTNSLYPLLQPYEQEGIIGLNIPIATFGTSNLNHSPKLQTESFVYRAKTEHPSNYTSKQFFRPLFHKTYEYGGNILAPGMIDPNGKQTRYNKCFRSSNQLRINHYATRSLDDWRKKVKRGWPIGRPGGDLNKNMFNKKFKVCNRNEIHDTSMHRFLPELKAKLGIAS